MAPIQLTQDFYFGFRTGLPPSRPWREELCARLPMTLRDGGEIVHGTEPAGRYRLVELANLAALFPEAAAWKEPHPCPPLGPVTGCLAVAFRSYWPFPRRARFAEQICRELRGPVACVERRRCIDAVRLHEVTLEQATSKYGFADSGMLFEDAAYLAYVERELERAARSVGASVHAIATSHNPFRLLDKGARIGASRTAAVWVHDAAVFEGPEAAAFFAD